MFAMLIMFSMQLKQKCDEWECKKDEGEKWSCKSKKKKNLLEVTCFLLYAKLKQIYTL